MSIIDKLNWRYATKRMNGTKVPSEKLNVILEATRLSASSYGLQPFSVIVVSNDELKAKLAPVAYNQPQITESSDILVFAVWETVTEAQIDAYLADIAATRGIPVESLDGFKGMLIGTTKNTPEQNQTWAAKQAYIALGTAMLAAAEVEVDATPMEGFNPAGVDEVLGLKEKGLKSVVLLPLGYRDAANDYLASAKKVRRAADKFIINM